ncbi:MAG: hypothetical protein AAGC60_13855 [Acidobacteriota bacterium]
MTIDILARRARRSALLLTTLLLGLGALGAVSADAADLQVLKKGLGDGVVVSNVAGVTCGFDCDQTYPDGTSVTLTATPDASSSFVRWQGACTHSATTCNVQLNSDRAVVAEFALTASIPQITNLTPSALDFYLMNNPVVDRPSRFLAALPPIFRQNWILMSRSESLQTGTARHPRILLPNADLTAVFSIGTAEHAAYPGAHPLAIEYMQWDAGDKNFRFHEIVLGSIGQMDAVPPRLRGVATDDFKCANCHTTGNILNKTSFPGTTGVTAGVVQPRNKPNWDTYDSWGGMLPFNRDRIYQGTLEETAFRSLFNLWNWRGDAVADDTRQILELLELQPSMPTPPGSLYSIVRNRPDITDAGHLTFSFNSNSSFMSPPPGIGYSFGGLPMAPSLVLRGGPYLTMQTRSTSSFPSDEGRGVQFFDLLGGLDGILNGQRIADELIDHRFATGSVPVDVRPLALAIATQCIVVDGATGTARSTGSRLLNVDTAFFDARNGMNLQSVVADTRVRQESLPRRKADIQKINLDRRGDIYLESGSTTPGLIGEYESTPDYSIQRIRSEVFRRPVDDGVPAVTVDREYVDREHYDRSLGRNARIVGLYRYFLEPLGVPVDSWSMSVRGRKRTYTFGDVFRQYIDQLTADLTNDLTNVRPIAGLSSPPQCNELIDVVNSQFAAGQLPAPLDPPTYTDVQRIFNRSCIECHGGLNYPPYANHPGTLDLSEIETPMQPGETRFSRAYEQADTNASFLLQRVTTGGEECPGGMMPCGGPALSQVDIETLTRWVDGGTPGTVGDPHIQTVDGVNYDFQAAGEFVLLRGEGLELQTRQVPVTTAGPLGPNGHTGLTSCVSLNGAVALRMRGHRITYQPTLDGPPNPEGLDLRIDGELVPQNKMPLVLGSVRVVQTPASGGVQVESIGGTKVTITPRFWHHHQVWYMDVELERARATAGLMGSIAPGDWLPTLPDGTALGPRPAVLEERYQQLYGELGEAWRATDDTSLFDYEPGTTTETFFYPEWPHGELPSDCTVFERPDGVEPPKALAPIAVWDAEQLCAGVVDPVRRTNCVQDVATTGEPAFADQYMLTESLVLEQAPEPVKLEQPDDFAVLGGTEVSLSWWLTEDPDGGDSYDRLCLWPATDTLSFDHCQAIDGDPIGGLVSHWVSKLEPGMAYFWKILAEDGKGEWSESETRRFELKSQ